MLHFGFRGFRFYRGIFGLKGCDFLDNYFFTSRANLAQLSCVYGLHQTPCRWIAGCLLLLHVSPLIPAPVLWSAGKNPEHCTYFCLVGESCTYLRLCMYLDMHLFRLSMLFYGYLAEWILLLAWKIMDEFFLCARIVLLFGGDYVSGRSWDRFSWTCR